MTAQKQDVKGINICNSITGISIKKIIIRSIIPDISEIKLIFVGPQTSQIKNILTKLENVIILTKQEKKELETAIPFYEKKFGILDNYNVYFIYKYFEENISIYHTKIILYNVIKETLGKKIDDKQFYPNNILLYKYARNIDYKYYINVLNYIFDGNYELSNENFFNKLHKITFRNKNEINTLLKNILPDKYSEINKSSFLNRDKFYYNECVNYEELFHILLNNPIILSHRYTYISDSTTNTYYGYQNIDYIINLLKKLYISNDIKSIDKDKNIEKLVKDVNFFLEQNISIDTIEYPYQNLDYFNKTVNNEYFIITRADIQKYIPQNLIEYYFPISDNKVETKIDKEGEYNLINSKFHFNFINKIIYQNDILTVQKCFCRNIIFESLSPNLDVKYELANLYNNLNTNYYCPVIKYISNGEVKYIKLNKKFMLNHTYSEISKLIINTDVLKGSNRYNLPYNDFIQYKWRISKSEILTVNFYENGYNIIYFDDNKNIPIDTKLFNYLELVPNTIKQFKKIINAKHLKLPNISNVFNEHADKINYSKLLNSNIIINCMLDIKKIQTSDETINANGKLNVQLFISRIRKYFQRIHHFALPKNVLSINSIKLFYKQVNQFYCERNIANFINASINEDRQEHKLTDKIIKQVGFLFYSTEKQIKKIFDNLDNYNLKTGEKKLLYGIEIEINITTEGLIDIYIENVDKYYNVRKILFYIKTIFSLIAWDIQNNNFKDNIYTNSSKTDKIKNKSFKKSKSKNQTINYDINNDINIDIDINIDNINLDSINKLDDKELEYDLDIKDLANLIKFDNIFAQDYLKKDNSIKSNISHADNEFKESSQEFKNLDLAKLFNKNKKITFTKYMKEMQRQKDKELFEPDVIGNKKFEYFRRCQNTPMKQPYIVSERDIQSYDDPEAFNGYLKYRGNYYICPRIWDYKANKPISVRKFIEAGLKSPYTNGTFINPENKQEIELDDKHTVIIRKPVSGSEWEDENKHPNWPTILKKTEKEAYPYLMFGKDHPQDLCVPCCGSKRPDDFDPNKKTIQQIFKPSASKNCRQKFEAELSQTLLSDKNNTEIKEKILFCSDKLEYLYITNENSDIDKCRFGLIPKNLDVLLNNHQNLFLKNQKQLLDYSNLFLRIGIEDNKKDNILETFSVITGKSIVGLKQLIVDKLTPEVFLSLNNGELVDIYSSNNILPNSLNDYIRFENFMKQYQLFFNILDIDYHILEKLKYKDIELLNIHIEDNTKLNNYMKDITSNVLKDNNNDFYVQKSNSESMNSITSGVDDLINLKKIIISYKIYSAFYNYISHILDENEFKNYTHFLDLFSQPIEWLNKDGANILIFDKTASKMICNPYNNLTRKKFIILIQESAFKFIPVVHVSSTNKNNKYWNGIFQYNNVNITEHSYNIFENKVSNKKLLELTKARENNLLNLTILHGSICKYQYTSQTTTFLDELENNNIKIINQIAFTTTQVEIIKLENVYSNLLIPIYPISISPKKLAMRFKFLEEKDLIPLDKYIHLPTLLKTTLIKYNYKISKIYYDEFENKINSIQFANNLIVPIQPMEYTLENKKQIIDMMVKAEEFKNAEDTKITGLFKPIYFNFQLEINPIKDIVNIRNNIYRDFIYNYFKYDFSRILQEIRNKNYIQSIEKHLMNITKKTNDYQNTIDNLIDNIILIMKHRIVGNENKSVINTKNYNKVSESNYIKLKVCKKTKKANRCQSRFCQMDKTTKQCHLDMNPEQLEYFAYLLANDLVNNKIESREILNGSFIPEFNMRNKIFRNPDEIILNTNELTSIIENGIYSKFKKNITLRDFLNMEDEYVFSKNDYAILEKTNIDEYKKIMNTVITDLIDLSIKNIFMDDKIYTTPFDKTGTYDYSSNVGECKFPFFNKNKKKFIYQCAPRSGGLMCPTKINFQRVPDKWGYCPEKIDETRRDLNVIDVNTVSSHDIGDKDGEYQAGKCKFPFAHKEISKIGNDIYKLKYDCNETASKDEYDEYSFKWCPIIQKHSNLNLKNSKKNIHQYQDVLKESDIGEGDLLRAANKFENIHLNKWYSGKMNIPAITTKKYLKGYCQPPLKTKKLKLGMKKPLNILQKINNVNNNTNKEPNIDDKDFEITLENYIPNNCSSTITPSKGGYKRYQLFNFGKNILKIPYTQLIKVSGEPLQKNKLCKIINAKYRDFKTHGKEITDADRLKAYEKNIEDCENGESKGGYSLNDLKELAINYYNITEEQIKDLTKPQICKYIKEQINSIKVKSDILAKQNNDNLDYKEYKHLQIYPGNINNCKESPNRGGFTKKKLQHIATKQFNINTEHKHKDEICDEIAEIIKTKKNIIGINSNKHHNTRLSNRKIYQMRNSFSDLFDDPSIAAIPNLDFANDIDEEESKNSILQSTNLSKIKSTKIIDNDNEL